MGLLELVLFAFAVGLTACGLAGSAMELVAGRRLAFAEPYVSPAHVLRSLAATACAGPFMLANDALDARRARPHFDADADVLRLHGRWPGRWRWASC